LLKWKKESGEGPEEAEARKTGEKAIRMAGRMIYETRN
jgi:hypothetical protein